MMSRSGKISVALSKQQLSDLRRIVEAGEFASAAEAVREAVRSFLHRRTLYAGPHGVSRFNRSVEARRDPPDPVERVDLLFDAGDAKA